MGYLFVKMQTLQSPIRSENQETFQYSLKKPLKTLKTKMLEKLINMSPYQSQLQCKGQFILLQQLLNRRKIETKTINTQSTLENY